MIFTDDGNKMLRKELLCLRPMKSLKPENRLYIYMVNLIDIII